MSASGRDRLLAALALAGVGTGVLLTALGLAALPAGASPISKHAPLVAWLFALFVLVAVAAQRWPVLSVPKVLVVLLMALAVATGQVAAFGLVLVLLLSAACAGRLVLPRRFAAGSELDRVLVGLAVFGTLVGATAHWPILYRGTFAALLVLPLGLGFRHLRTMLGGLAHWFTDSTPSPLRTRLIEAALAAVAAPLVLIALMPERGHDALAFHLLVPQWVAVHQHWSFDVERYVWAVMPMLGDWLYCFGVVLDGETAARLVHVACLLLVTRLVFELARWTGAGPNGGRLAAVMFASTPLVFAEASSLFVDSVWTALVLGGAFAVLRASAAAPFAAAPRDLVLAGVLLGGALAAKAVTFMVLPVLALVLLLRWRSWLGRERLPALAAGAAAFTLVGAVPYARAFVLTGNPVFPFFNGVFQSPLYPGEDFQAPSVFDRGMGVDVLHRITFDSSRFLEGLPGASGFQWLLLVGPALLVLLVARQWRALAVWSIAAASAFTTFQQTAYLRYVLPAFALAAASLGAFWSHPRRLVHAPAWGAAIAALVLNVLFLSSGGFVHELRQRVWFSDAAREDFLSTRAPLRLAVDAADALNPSGNPVAFFAPPFAAGLRAKALFPNWYNHRFAGEVAAADSAPALGALLGRHHVRYLLLDDFWSDEAARERVRGCSRLLRRWSHIELRELAPEHHAARELLRSGELVGNAGETAPAAWYAPHGVTFTGSGCVMTNGAVLNQAVPVTAEREHVAEVTLAPAPSAGAATLLLVFHDRSGDAVGSETLPLPPGTTTRRLVAPRGAASATVSVSCTSGTVVVTRVSLRD